MMAEARQFSENPKVATTPLRVGVTSGLRPLPSWKREADFLFVQVGFTLDALLAWRATLDFDGPIYAGVMAVPSATMARKLSTDIPELAVPEPIILRIEQDRDAGIELACDLVNAIRDAGFFAGVHLIPVARYREVAARLERVL